MDEPSHQAQRSITREEALQNAARLLQAAEAETDRGLMGCYESLADSWIRIAEIPGL